VIIITVSSVPVMVKGRPMVKFQDYTPFAWALFGIGVVGILTTAGYFYFLPYRDWSSRVLNTAQDVGESFWRWVGVKK